MPRSTRCLMALCPLLLATACAQSIHQTERLTKGDYDVDSGFAGDQSYSYWPGTGYGAGYGIGYGAGYLGESARVLRVSVRPVLVLAGIEGMAALAERAIRQVPMDHIPRHRLMRRRNLKKILKNVRRLKPAKVHHSFFAPFS